MEFCAPPQAVQLLHSATWGWVKTKAPGTAGLSPCFHLPEIHLGYLFLTHAHIKEQTHPCYADSVQKCLHCDANLAMDVILHKYAVFVCGFVLFESKQLQATAVSLMHGPRIV